MAQPKFHRPSSKPDLEVELFLFETSAGGRDQPLWQGCRVPHDFGHQGGFNTGVYEFADAPPQPGETAKALLWLLAPEVNAGRLRDGFVYQIWDGRFIGRGTILRILNPILESAV